MTENREPRASGAWAETPIMGLYATAPEPLPFAADQEIRAFLLGRGADDVAIYSVSDLDTTGASRHYLNHWHESLFASERAAAPLHVHVDDRPETEKRYDVHAAFSERHAVDGDLEVIPIPGHTAGATAYLWSTDAGRALFTGDSIYLADGEWVAAVLDSSDREAYLASLELIRSLEFDLLVPWAASRGGPFYARTDRADAQRRIEAIIERVRRGESR